MSLRISDFNLPPQIIIDPSLADWFERADAKDLFRINLKELASATNLDWKHLLEIFLDLVSLGKLHLNWEFHCPDCDAIPDFRHNLKEVKGEGFCPMCDLKFRNTLDKNVDVTFTVHPSVFAIPQEITDSFRETMLERAKLRIARNPGPHLSGMECLTNEKFRDLFGGDVLSVDESLAIQNAVFLFTDIKGSTQMYTDLGDARSYQIVREHFKILFGSVIKAGGTVVKTIGDAVMAAFLTGGDALRAAVEAHEAFKQYKWDHVGYLSIKMGIHAGPSIVVNLNNAVDYFGNSVNLAARIQSSVDDHSIRFSSKIFDDPSALSYLKGLKASLKKRQETFKGINDPIEVYTYSP